MTSFPYKIYMFNLSQFMKRFMIIIKCFFYKLMIKSYLKYLLYLKINRTNTLLNVQDNLSQLGIFEFYSKFNYTYSIEMAQF